MNTLSSYLKARSIKQAEFAEEVGISQGTVSRLASGSLVPSLSVAVRIERHTGGAVPVSSWLASSDLEPPASEDAA